MWQNGIGLESNPIPFANLFFNKISFLKPYSNKGLEHWFYRTGNGGRHNLTLCNQTYNNNTAKDGLTLAVKKPIYKVRYLTQPLYKFVYQQNFLYKL